MQSRYKGAFWVLLSATALICALTGQSVGQYQYYPPPPGPYPPPPGPGYPGGYYPPYPGSSWVGSGQALDAYANLGVSQEQARILREQANQAKIDTKKQTIDLLEYERAHKYWYADQKADTVAKQVEAAMNSPPIADITSGRSLNILLPFVDKLINLGMRGPNVPLDPGVVSNLNIALGDDGGNAGMLKEFNSIQWPPVLVSPEQQHLDDLFKKAVSEASVGQVPLTTIRDITKQTDALEAALKNKYYKSEIDGSDLLDGNRFIARLRDGTKALKAPNVTRVLAGQLAPRGDTIDELVENMSGKGLTFARAQPGQEDAYVAVHRAMVNYAMGAGTPDTGFRVQLSGAPGKSIK
jgi:hypothetical protein